MSKQQIYEQMQVLWSQFEEAHNGTTKKSQAQARKLINELKKLVTAYRKASTQEAKQAK